MQLISAAFLAIIPFASSAPAFAGQTFEALGRSVRVGNRIEIQDRSGAKIQGRLTALSAEQITIETPAGERRFPHDAVASVAVRGRYAKRGALAGAAVGAALCIACIDEDADAPVLTGLLGAAGGAIVGAFIPRTRVVFRAAAKEVSLVPQAVTRGASAAIVVRW